MDVCVCWKVPTINLPTGRLDKTYGQGQDLRRCYGGSYVWHDDNESFKVHVISLEVLVAELLCKFEADNGAPGRGCEQVKLLEGIFDEYSY